MKLVGSTVYVVGRWDDLDRGWEVQGVFTTEELARAACTREDDFIGPVELDARLPEERLQWPGLFYPNLPDASHS